MNRFLPIFLIGAFTFIFACKNEPSDGTKTASTNAVVTPGHLRMVAILDSIAKNASPMDCYLLNSKKAEIYLQQYQAAPPEQRPFGQFKYAEQLLYAGKTEAATMQFLEVIQQTGDQLNEETKLLYEMLALSYLRLGEQENCIQRHNAESCILPISGGGVYKLTAGPENAIKVYERILKKFPNDLQSQWLLNIAYMALGKYPSGVPKQWVVPDKIFKSKGDFDFKDVAGIAGLDIQGLSGGVCLEDFDNDGDLDLFMTSYGLSDPVRFFLNNGDGSFSERTHEANLDGIVSGLNTLHADYDNDGDRDIFVLRGGWLEGGTHPNSLLRNNGDGTFTDVTIEAGLLSFHPTQTGAWADYDGDGHLDIYIANETRDPKKQHPNELYRNNGDGTFTDVAQQLGVNYTGFYKGCVWGDINNDRLPDLYLSNMSGNNRLFVNRGKKFEEMAEKAGVNNPQMSFPCWFFDYNNDGWADLAVSGYNFDPEQRSGGDMLLELQGKLPPGDWFRLYKNNGNETFTDVTKEAGMNKLTFAMGCSFGDLDNDGWLDFYLGTGKPDFRSLVPNRMFRNVEGKRFDEVTMDGFAHVQKGHAVVFGDLDNDGDQDIYEVMGGAYEGDVASNILFENTEKTSNHWLKLELRGKACNRDAIGAKIAVHTVQKDGKTHTVWTTVNTGTSFGSVPLRREIGLGPAEKITSIEVFWPKPGPEKTVFQNVPLDSWVKISEGNSNVEILKRNSFALTGKNQ